MRPANQKKQVMFWCDIFPNMERKLIFLNANPPQNPPTYPNKRFWVTVEIPGDEELWPELFSGDELKVTKINLEGQ